jgi:hypothetical protein
MELREVGVADKCDRALVTLSACLAERDAAQKEMWWRQMLRVLTHLAMMRG